GLATITAIRPSFSLMATTGQLSYPRNSENASPPGTFNAYLSCAEMATPLTTASAPVTNPTASMLLRFIATPPLSRLTSLLLRLTALHNPRSLNDGWPSDASPTTNDTCGRFRRSAARFRVEPTLPRSGFHRLLESICHLERDRDHRQGGIDAARG